MTKRLALTLLLAISICSQVLSQQKAGNPGDDYPMPAKSDKLLFCVQRSHNKNTIVYDLNTLPDGSLDKDAPIHPYWIRYEEGGNLQELSFIQRKYAYGLNYEVSDAQKGSYKVTFVCYNKKSLVLMKGGKDHRYHAYVSLNNRVLELNRVFVKTEGGTFWFPVVKYIDISGIDIKTGAFVTERFVP